MSIEIQEINDCKREIVAQLPAESLEAEIERLARQYARDVKVPGFRPGKVPLTIVKQRYRTELRQEAAHDLVERTWKDTITERNLKPLTRPSIEELKTDPGNPVSFKVRFEVMPEVELGTYTGVSVTVPDQKIEESDVEQALAGLRERHAQFIPVEEGEIRDGHMVTLSIKGTFDDGGNPIDDDNAEVTIGDPDTVVEFNENLRGAKVGEIRTFDVSYPADFHRKRFAGQTVHYSVTVKEIKQKSLPELGDDFATDYGANSLEELKNQIREDLVTRAGRAAEKKAREAVLDEIVRSLSFDIPDCLVEEELENRARRLAFSLAQQGVDVSRTSIDWGKMMSEERPGAERSVRESIVLSAIAHRESIEVPEIDLEEQFKRMAEGTSQSASALRAQFEKDGRIESLRDRMRQDKALDFIFRNATISRG